MKAGLYFHIPFCVKKCAYCDFYSISDASSQRAYFEAIRKEMDKRKKEAAQLSDPKKAKKAARKAEKDARKEGKKNSKKRKDNNGEAEKPDTDVKPEEEKEDDA